MEAADEVRLTEEQEKKKTFSWRPNSELRKVGAQRLGGYRGWFTVTLRQWSPLNPNPCSFNLHVLLCVMPATFAVLLFIHYL